MASVANIVYLIWLIFQIHSIPGLLFLVLESLSMLILLIFIFNHFERRYDLIGGSYSWRVPVDVFIATVDEPVSLLEPTIAAAAAINHPDKLVYVLDDGHRPWVKELAHKYGCQYLCRPDAASKRYKAANLNYGLKKSRGSFILTLDADSVADPNILDDLLGHFSHKDIALVASRQAFNVHEKDFNHDHLFYEYMQSGKNKDGVAISCGSGVIYRRVALEDIGGFSEWNLVEDLHTTYVLNQFGWRSLYVKQAYVLSTAPLDLRTIYKQRGTWALDTLRLLFWQSPFRRRRLNFRQKLHYFEIGYTYLVSAFVLPGIFCLNIYALLTNTEIIHNGLGYVVMRTPALIATLLLFGRFSRGQLPTRMWAGLFPVYIKASLVALFHPRKVPAYKVTNKTGQTQRELLLVLPQALLIAGGCASLIFSAIHYGPRPLLALCGFWIIVMTYWLWPVLMRGMRPLSVVAAEDETTITN